MALRLWSLFMLFDVVQSVIRSTQTLEKREPRIFGQANTTINIRNEYKTNLGARTATITTWTREFIDMRMMSLIFYKAKTPWMYLCIMILVCSSTALLTVIACQCVLDADSAGTIYGHIESIRNTMEQCGRQRSHKLLKDELRDMFPALNNRAHVRECRQMIKSRILEIFEELVADGTVDKNDHLICSDADSKNVFAKIAAGSMSQNSMDKEQVALGSYQDRFVICANRRMDDLQWKTTDPEFIPRASMSAKHRFLTIKDLHWQWFNPIVYGLVPKSHGGVSIADALSMVENIEAAAMHYVSNSSGWSKDVQLFFNPYPHNGFTALTIHILDMNQLGLSFEYHQHKNCPLNLLKEALQEEIRAICSGDIPSNNGERSKCRMDAISVPSDGESETDRETAP